MTVFVDTSALYALLDADDERHSRAVAGAERCLGEELVTHAFVVVELVSLVRRRLGPDAAARLIDDVLPAVSIVDVDAALRRQALEAFRAAVTTGISLVDRTSFAFMRAHGIARAFAIDADFAAEGFELVS